MVNADRESLFEEIYQRNKNNLLRSAYRTARNKEDAEDIVEETFLRFLQKWDAGIVEDPDRYLFGILSRVSLNYISRQKHRNGIPLEYVEEVIAAPPAEGKLEDILPFDIAGTDREILILRLEQNLSYVRIAKMLGISEISCRSRFFRAKTRLRKYFEK